MNPLLGALLLVLIGLLGARVSFAGRESGLGPRLVLDTGVHFLLLGFLLGSHVLDVLTRDLIDRLYPFLALGLGWIGLLFGLQLDRRQLAHFPSSFLLLTVLQAVLTFALFFAVGAAVLATHIDASMPARIALLTAAATACVSTPAGIALIRHKFVVRGKVSELLLFIASLDAVVGILALQATYSFYHPAGAVIGAGGGWEWLAVAGALAVILAVIFLWLTRPKPERDELVLFLLGLVVFASGSSLYLGLSPLFVCGVLGTIIANLSPMRRRVYAVLEAWEKPIYVVLLILSGALLQFPTWVVVPLALGYLLVRGGAKLVAGWALTPVFRPPFPVPRRLGLGLIPQGGISIAMAISATLTYGALADEGARTIQTLFSTVLLGVVLSELAGPFLTRNLLRRAGEIRPRVEAALAEGRRPSAAEALGPASRGARRARGRDGGEADAGP